MKTLACAKTGTAISQGETNLIFFSALSGSKPTVKEKHWSNYTDFVEDLLTTSVTWTNTLQLTLTPPILTMDLVHTRKRKKPQTKENYDNEWNAKKPSGEYNPFLP